MRYEPTDLQSEPFGLFQGYQQGCLSIGHVELQGSFNVGRIGNFYDSPANKHIGQVNNRGSVTFSASSVFVNADTFDVSGTPHSPISTTLTSGQVNNNSGTTLTQPVACIGDLTLVS